MKWSLILAGALTGCLLATPVLAEPSVELDDSTFTVKEAVNDQILAQIKADLGKVENMAELAFELEEISNEDLAKICGLCPQMVNLEVSSEKVTDLSPLAKLSNLKELLLEVAATDFSPLKGLTGLTKISAESPKMGPDLTWMSGMTKLEYVTIDSETELSLVGLPTLPQLEEAMFLNAKINDLSPLVQAMPGLQTIELRGATIADLSPLAKLASLTDVNLYGATVKDFSPLAACPKLEKLTYYGTESADYSTLGKLTQVTELNGGLTKMNNINWLAGMTNLRIFDVFAEYVTDYSPLSKSKVEEFQVWNMRVPVGDVAAIGQTVSLRKLTFWDVEGASNSKSLSNLINLERITIQGYNKKGGEAFDMNAAAKWDKVKKAAFEDATFVNSDGLAGMKAIEDLRICKANLKAEKGLSLAFLGKLSTLKNLHIDQCKISNPEALAQCTSLTNVRITKTEGMTSLAPLHKLPNLKRVTVSKGVYPEAELKGFGPNVKVVQN